MSTIEKTFANGEVIIKEGDIGNNFFQILEGNAGVYKNYGLEDQVKLTVLVPGQYFGEMAVIESYPRSSTVVAESDVKVVEIPADNLNSYFVERPDEILAIMKHLGSRLKERRLCCFTEKAYRFLQEQEDRYRQTECRSTSRISRSSFRSGFR